MTLRAGTRLGPFEILSPIGAGGMGEVYRGRDERLKRDVAIKVLPASYSQDADRLRRFEQEAQAAGGLNHPNITAVYDIGQHEGAPYVVQELLEGETLRAVLAGGGLSQRKAIDYALQAAHGLAAAHEKGIVHRDLKPENLFVLNDGRVKILDFGLAKLTQPEGASGPETNLPTATPGTEPGVVLGTLGYMSPEQVRGKPADARSDIFSFGAILYETLSGNRAFRGDSAADTMSAILKEDPPDLSVTNQNISPGLERIVRHCLEKAPEQRFRSAHDLAFDLEALSGISGVPGLARKTPDLLVGRRFGSLFIAAAALAACVVLGHFLWRPAVSEPPNFKRLTFRRGTIWSARFAPEGRTIVYSAAWEGKPMELFSARPDSPEYRPLGFKEASILAISGSGEMALLFRPHSVSGAGGLGGYLGTLARAPLAGGAPHEVLEDAQFADWAPDATSLAVVRPVKDRNRVEFPTGKVLYETGDNILALRISPNGNLFALAEHSPGFGGNGSISILDRGGKKRTLASGLVGDFADLAWSPAGNEIWFNAGISGSNTLNAVTLAGQQRVLARVPGRLQLLDISSDGRALVNRNSWRVGILGSLPGQQKEREFSWLDVSEADDVAPDGSALLITEFGEGGGIPWSVYLRRTDGSAAVRLGDGQAMSLSPDGKRVLAMLRTSPPQLVLYPTGPGEPIRLANETVSDYYWGLWLPDGKRIIFT
ncbi:MAG: protein kinase, partial [Thermoanaerobaculia bacterium]